MEIKKDKLTREEKLEIARQKRNAYQRKWRKENKDKVKEYNENYWIKKVEEKMQEEA